MFVAILMSSCNIITNLSSGVARKRQSVELKTVIYQSVSELPEEVWALRDMSHKKFLCDRYFIALEHSNDNELELRFAVCYDAQNKIAGFISFQITHFTTSIDAYSNPILRTAHKLTRFVRRGHVHNILICGNAFATGEHGYIFTDAVPEDQKARLIFSSMKIIEQQEKQRGKRICAMLAKDFYPNSQTITKNLGKLGFKSFQVDHNMVMPIDSNWKSFDDYLQDMNTKFRTKAKAALKRSAVLRVYQPDSDQLNTALPKMKELYMAVHERADFRLGKMDLESLRWLNNPDQQGGFQIRNYEFNNELVGFSTSMICGDTLEAHIIGIDYTHNKDAAVYQRVLYDFIDQAIQNNCRRIVFGRTAAEIKSSIGAVPVDLTCCIYHPKKISNALLSLILQYVKPSEYPHREPFKSETEARLKNISLY